MSKTIIVSYSELDTFRQCPLKHALAYKQRWTKPVEDGPLAKGTLWHAVMETHYRTIREMSRRLSGAQVENMTEEILAHALEQVRPLLQHAQSGVSSEIQDLIEWMYHGYVAQWGVDSQWRIEATEHTIVVPLRNADGRPTRFRLKAKIDLLVRDRATGLLWVVDHKSGKDLPKTQELDLDDQFGLYTLLLNRVNRPVIGSIHNAARTYRTIKPQELGDRFSRTLMNRTKVELQNIEQDAWRTARMAYSAMNEIPFSSPDPRQCGWKCNYRDPHLLARKGVPIESALLDYDFVIDNTRH